MPRCVLCAALRPRRGNVAASRAVRRASLQHACVLANVPEENIKQALDAIAAAEGITATGPATLYIAKDTRPSSEVSSRLV